MNRPSKRLVQAPREGRALVAGSSDREQMRLAAQATKGELRATIDKLGARIEHLGSERKRLRKDLEAARAEIVTRGERLDDCQSRLRQASKDLRKEVTRLEKRVDTENKAWLKAQARVSELEQPQRRAEAALDRNAEDRIKKLTAAVKRYKDEANQLRAELATRCPVQKQLLTRPDSPRLCLWKTEGNEPTGVA